MQGWRKRGPGPATSLPRSSKKYPSRSPLRSRQGMHSHSESVRATSCPGHHQYPVPRQPHLDSSTDTQSPRCRLAKLTMSDSICKERRQGPGRGGGRGRSRQAQRQLRGRYTTTPPRSPLSSSACSPRSASAARTPSSSYPPQQQFSSAAPPPRRTSSVRYGGNSAGTGTARSSPRTGSRWSP